jgi:hypothetical protein
MRTVVIVGQDRMGHGDQELGRKILATFLRKATTIRELEAIVFWNTGVHLLRAGSPILAELSILARNGVDLLPCSTCVEHFGMELALGEPSGMDSILREIDRAEKVVTL